MKLLNKEDSNLGILHTFLKQGVHASHIVVQQVNWHLGEVRFLEVPTHSLNLFQPTTLSKRKNMKNVINIIV